MGIRMATINAWSLEMVGPVNFNLKWHFGVPRPEEVAWLICLGRLNTEDHGVPKDIVRDIQNMNLQSATDFTAYPKDGSPMHPCFPRDRPAASGCRPCTTSTPTSTSTHFAPTMESPLHAPLPECITHRTISPD